MGGLLLDIGGSSQLLNIFNAFLPYLGYVAQAINSLPVFRGGAASIAEWSKASAITKIKEL